jgi:hypothetical protein
VADCCEHGNELLGSIKGGGFLDNPSNYYLHNKDFVPWRNLFCCKINPKLNIKYAISDYIILLPKSFYFQ